MGNTNMGNTNNIFDLINNALRQSYIDINDVLKLDTDLIQSASMIDGNNEKLKELDKKVQKMSDLVKNEKGEKIILQQSNLTDLVEKESIRLDEQKESIEMAKISQRRLISLNENNIKRQSEYLKITTLGLFEVVFIIVMTMLKIPMAIYLTMTIITGSLVVICCLTIVTSIISRDNIYFDELSTEAPILTSRNQVASNKIDAGVNLLGNIDASGNLLHNLGALLRKNIDASGNLINANSCSGNSCCSTSTMWDPKVEKCVKLIDGFSTINTAYDDNMIVEKKSKSIEKNTIDGIIPFQISEYEKYSKI